ncbi:uncharacterized protein LOC128279448 [Gossypium arboreum]|uniref:uncharacterized protein LOC128279448 n=1 Tax=Gossypium arboreum TaxID=29729 RepID=UPI0022F14D62|nr:uncharacterized protein LOC128279448 [Gossypium arboreum]
MHPGGNKMYQDLQVFYWWPWLKKDVVAFIAESDIYHWLSLRTKTVIRGVFRWLRLRHFMVGSVGLHFVGLTWRKRGIWVQIWFVKHKAKLICESLKVASNRHRSYACLRRQDTEYQVDDKVFLKVSPWKKVLSFGRKGKLSLRFIGPYELIERIGPVTA